VTAGPWTAFEEQRPAGPHLRVWDGRDFQQLEWDDWRRGALRAAAGLRDIGVAPGDSVGCILTNTPDVCKGVVGVWLAGATVVSLPTLARGADLLTYAAQLRRSCALAETGTLLVEEQFAAPLREVMPELQIVTWEDLPSDRAAEPSSPGGGTAFVQFSSGSTQEPRGCALSGEAIDSQLDILAEGLRLDPVSDEGVSWLPLSHDMGFFGCLMLSFVKGMRLTVGTPQRFLRSPRTWWSDCADVGATITAAPNFALDLAARTAGSSPPRPCPMRKCVIGGERVEPRTLEAAVAALAPWGLSPEALLPAYGLAEAVLAVTMTPFAEAPRVLAVDAAALRDRRLVPLADGDEDGAEATHLVSAGRPLREVDLEIAGEGEVGEIYLRSPSLASGYLNNPDATRERFADGWLQTRDLGFLHDGMLYIHGRLDDMLNVAGRNIWARDVEAEIARQAPVRPGSCVLVDLVVDGDAKLVLVAEPKSGGAPEEIASVGRRVALETVGARLDQCVVLARGAMPKTPSGKVQRYRCREILQSIEDGATNHVVL
jgi:fatty-acyl-CoA synthase